MARQKPTVCLSQLDVRPASCTSFLYNPVLRRFSLLTSTFSHGPRFLLAVTKDLLHPLLRLLLFL